MCYQDSFNFLDHKYQNEQFQYYMHLTYHHQDIIQNIYTLNAFLRFCVLGEFLFLSLYCGVLEMLLF